MEQILVKFAGKLIAGFKLAASFIVARVLAAFGLSWVTYSATMPVIKAWIVGKFAGLDSRVVDFFGYVGLDIAIIMVVSALVTKIGTRVFLASASKLEEMIGQANH
ncbi:DUF2523 family protein [uncultured Stenotrophomonas sp.]|jgi:hypothetical protein|uniref:DUF2523 family protein n=1 Tax=uncultured Stenotrophomonas sp. TaxID=165438 RepID=UPI0025FD10C9|nr:DUF2523 family protein [uncultured Stenotrophomonas sp.]